MRASSAGEKSSLLVQEDLMTETATRSTPEETITEAWINARL